MLRASAIVEKAGVPSVSLVCDGFLGQARALSGGLGIAGLPVARVVGHVDGQSAGELTDNLIKVTVDDVVRHLTSAPEAVGDAGEIAPADGIAARGSFDEINRVFLERQWSDGLPIVPPTAEKVAAFLAHTSDDPDRVIGVLQPSGSCATVRNVAVNGVMANCRPEHMPVLVAIAEVLADPGYGVEHSGDTTGGEALIILNGPVVGALGFNCEGAALRDGYHANTSVGRFLRLYLRNVARFLPGGADKATFGNTWRVVLAENEAACGDLGWPPLSADLGFAAGENVVTIGRFTAGGVVGSIFGGSAEAILPYLADGLVRQVSWELAFTVGFAPGTYRPLLVLSPLVARTLAGSGLSKRDVQEALFRLARLPAQKLEAYIGAWSNLVPGQQTLRRLVEAGQAEPLFAESDDPDRLVPIAVRPEDILLVVSGDPLRSNAYAFASNGMHGFPTSKRIRLMPK
ncbi:MAG TPA: UGSC family (seleno)protein [Alphaproteobacteria bacterium]|nr:UGSC family (seleno)protein [Alphaproteobacteria bacterium]